jgi:hypothetical protein
MKRAMPPLFRRYAASRPSGRVRGRRLAVAVAAACCWTFSLACASPVAQASQPVRLAGVNPLASAMTQTLGERFPALAFEITSDPGAVNGGVANVRALQDGTADLALTFANVAYTGYIGRLDDSPGRLDKVRGIAVLYLTPMHLVVRRDSPVRSLADLKGRAVAAGRPGSGTPLTAALALRAAGVSEKDISQQWLTYNEATARLISGELDAMFVNQGYPSDAVRTAMQAGARLLDLAGSDIDHLRAEYPFLRAALIPEHTYPGQLRAVRTIGVDTLLVSRAGLDEALVYKLTQGLFATLPTLAVRIPALRRMELNRAAAMPIPLHPGAARYYREQELSR